jgi:hypothetical protein
MSPSIIFPCPGCKARIRAPFQLRGQARSCPGCGHRFIIRFPAPVEQGPVLVPDDQPDGGSAQAVLQAGALPASR